MITTQNSATRRATKLTSCVYKTSDTPVSADLVVQLGQDQLESLGVVGLCPNEETTSQTDPSPRCRTRIFARA